MTSKRKFLQFIVGIIVSYIAVVFLVAAANPPIQIMPLGDSMTKGQGNGAYRTKLYELLSQAGYAFNFVGTQSDGPANLPDKHHEGHGGFTIGPGASTLDKFTNGKGNLYVNMDTYLQKNPDVILMNIGWNEYFNVKTPNFNPDQEAPKRLANLLEKIYQKQPKVAIFAFLPHPGKVER
ncbi:hypothetical protein K9N68_31225 [Kovacikia minuta CCNUW1]|uniref:SGNH/GDSL hydrolase family protein n=1 Tax=Kovacikia minuta TaxID=2931930 RepID=UPI001CCF119E|nr:SGNH/GDSL hydrolase family protein [Kovacikia minuta]UBF25960.1 hypothetical protein K9N68_31225 [Kovacikia minuta CCNUW1]